MGIINNYWHIDITKNRPVLISFLFWFVLLEMVLNRTG